MGLSSFNRMRRERNPVEKIEAERFKNWNEAHHKGRDVQADATEANDKLNAKAAKAEQEAVKAIGAKVEAGLTSGDKKGGVIDQPLREDHAAEIAGRNIEDVQEPKDPVARREERIPDGTANEELVPHTQVDRPGPTAEMVDAALVESGLPAASDGSDNSLTADSGEKPAKRKYTRREK